MTYESESAGHWGGIIPVHERQQIPGFVPIPEIFTPTEGPQELTLDVIDNIQLGLEHKRWILNELTIRVVNACLLLASERDEWIGPRDIAEYGTSAFPMDNTNAWVPYSKLLEPVVFKRSLDYLDTLRFDADGGTTFIERKKHGAGGGTNQHGYRIHPDISFNDRRE